MDEIHFDENLTSPLLFLSENDKVVKNKGNSGYHLSYLNIILSEMDYSFTFLVETTFKNEIQLGVMHLDGPKLEYSKTQKKI